MNVLSLPPRHFSTISCSYKPHNATSLFSATKLSLPARDRVVDFGKFKGKMLGTLPSTYLKWVSRNLRARDFEDWAKLADEVLNDPIYKDRIEWEFAEKLLHGDVKGTTHNDVVSELLEISERFGWDNEDKVAWKRIDFNLLGTSKGARIPRVHENRKTVKTISLDGDGDKTRPRSSRSFNLSHSKKNVERKMGYSKKDEVRVCDNEIEERRKERRERLRVSRSSGNSSSKGSAMKGATERMEKMGIEDNDKGSLGTLDNFRSKGNQDIDEGQVAKVQSPFPGREALLKKVLNSRKL